MGISNLLDKDPGKYRTGRWFRRLGAAMTRTNPLWHIDITGKIPANMRLPYLVIGNHQSLADIPVVSRLPWEMKWVGKKSLFSLPLLGWMMRLSRDIPVDRTSRRSRAQVFIDAKDRIGKRVSVLIFPEGTRSPDGRIHAFSEGAFSLALKLGVPVLPIVVDGTFDAIPKNNWKFGSRSDIRIHIFDPVDVTEWKRNTSGLCKHVRDMIVAKAASWRNVDPSEVDALESDLSEPDEILLQGSNR